MEGLVFASRPTVVWFIPSINVGVSCRVPAKSLNSIIDPKHGLEQVDQGFEDSTGCRQSSAWKPTANPIKAANISSRARASRTLGRYAENIQITNENETYYSTYCCTVTTNECDPGLPIGVALYLINILRERNISRGITHNSVVQNIPCTAQHVSPFAREYMYVVGGGGCLTGETCLRHF